MKKLLFILMMPSLCFGQVKVEVTEKKQETFSQSYREGVKAAAARTEAAAAAQTAKAATAAAMSEGKVEIKVPITVDLNNYTHIAIINSVYNNLGSETTFYDMARNLADGPFTVLNPYVVDRKRAKKVDKRFLRESKNPNWLYYYYNKSIQGVDEVRRIIIRDYQNKILYNITTTNTPFVEMIEPILFFENSFNETEKEISYDSKKTQEAEAKAKAEYEAKVKQEAEAKAKAEYEAKVKQEAEAKAKADYEVKSEPATKPSKEIIADSVQLLDITSDNMKIFDYSTLEVGDQVVFKFVGINRGIIKRVIGDGKEYVISNYEYYPWGTYDINYGELYVKNKKITGYKKSN